MTDVLYHVRNGVNEARRLCPSKVESGSVDGCG